MNRLLEKISIDISCRISAKHVMSRFIFFKTINMYLKILSAAVVIGALKKVKYVLKH